MKTTRNAKFIKEQIMLVKEALHNIHTMDLLFKETEEFAHAERYLLDAVIALQNYEHEVIEIELDYTQAFDGDGFTEYRHKSGK